MIWSFSVFFPTFSQFFLRTWAHQDSFWFTQVFSTICHQFLLAYANSYPALWIRHPIAIRNSITIVVYLAHSWHFHFHLHLHFHFPFSTVTLIVILQTGERVQFSVEREICIFSSPRRRRRRHLSLSDWWCWCVYCVLFSKPKSWTNKVLRLLKGSTICIERRQRHIQILIKVAPREYHLSFIIAKDALQELEDMQIVLPRYLKPGYPFFLCV